MTAICPVRRMCVCACTLRLGYVLLVGVGVQVAVYCNTAPTVCNSMGDVGTQQSMLVIKTQALVPCCCHEAKTVTWGNAVLSVLRFRFVLVTSINKCFSVTRNYQCFSCSESVQRGHVEGVWTVDICHVNASPGFVCVMTLTASRGTPKFIPVPLKLYLKLFG